MDKAQRRVIIFRDICCILVGVTGLMQQTFIGPVSPVLVPTFMGLLLGPAGFALWAQRNSGGLITTSSSSESPPEPSSLPQSP